MGQFCGTLEQCGGTDEKYGKVWWNIEPVEQYAGPVEQYNQTVEQCEGTVWNGMKEQWNSVLEK